MRMSRHFGETLRKPPADADTASQRLLLRAGYVRAAAPGIFSLLPLGLRTLRKIEAVVREEMEAIGGQEVALPLLQPAALLERSGRWVEAGDELTRLNDRAGRRYALASSHEEAAAELARSEIRSYRQLPAVLFQIKTVFRDEPRPRGGLLRAREFTLLASYSFDRDPAGQEESYRKHRDTFSRIFGRVGLEDVVLAVSSAPGASEELEQEFVFLGEAGDDAVVICDSCGYTASQRAAAFTKPEPPKEEPQPLEKAATPGADTIESVAEFLGVSTDRTAKVVFFSATLPEEEAASGAGDVVVMALVRGDMEVSETKLAAVLGGARPEPAKADAIRDTGAEPGYASPIGLDAPRLRVVVDTLVAASPNLVSGANEAGFHYRNVNYERDYMAHTVADIAAVSDGAPCPACQARLRLAAGLELGSLHQFGTRYAEKLEVTYQDDDGVLKPMAMGSYGIGLGRLLSCVAEGHHDEQGLRLPITIAPYQVYLIAITRSDERIAERAEVLYDDLRDAGIEVLFDDRDASPGVKFKDADLIGIPIRVTLGPKTLEQGGVEVKRRDEAEARIVTLDDAVETVTRLTLELLTVEPSAF